MRADELVALREQKKQLMAEMRALADRTRWSGSDEQRFNELEREAMHINEQLEKQHQAELAEIRGAGGEGYRAVSGNHGLAPMFEAFRGAGYEHGKQTGELAWKEYRAVTWSSGADALAPERASAGMLGADQRYAYPAFTQVSVGSDITSVQILRQSARSLATAANVVRAIDAVTAKPETGSTLEMVTVSMKQVATIQTNVPNIYLEQSAAAAAVEQDLRLAVNEGLDKLILDAIASSGFQAPGTDPLLISIRKAMSTIQAAGYSPDTVILTPANAEALDTLRTSGPELMYVFAAGGLAPRELYGLNTRISKTVPAPVVADSTALGKLYASPVRLASFEADSGTTNRSNVRLELNACFGVERQAAAVRIAAS